MSQQLVITRYRRPWTERRIGLGTASKPSSLFHRTVSSVLTACLTSGGHRKLQLRGVSLTSDHLARFLFRRVDAPRDWTNIRAAGHISVVHICFWKTLTPRSLSQNTAHACWLLRALPERLVLGTLDPDSKVALESLERSPLDEWRSEPEKF